jgi:hypothetical protein
MEDQNAQEALRRQEEQDARKRKQAQAPAHEPHRGLDHNVREKLGMVTGNVAGVATGVHDAAQGLESVSQDSGRIVKEILEMLMLLIASMRRGRKLGEQEEELLGEQVTEEEVPSGYEGGRPLTLEAGQELPLAIKRQDLAGKRGVPRSLASVADELADLLEKATPEEVAAVQEVIAKGAQGQDSETQEILKTSSEMIGAMGASDVDASVALAGKLSGLVGNASDQSLANVEGVFRDAIAAIQSKEVAAGVAIPDSLPDLLSLTYDLTAGKASSPAVGNLVGEIQPEEIDAGQGESGVELIPEEPSVGGIAV